MTAEELGIRRRSVDIAGDDTKQYSICSNVDAPRDYHTKRSQRKTSIIYHLYVESNKNDSKELIYKTETNSQVLKSILWLPQE